MLKFLSLLTILQSFLQPGNAQADINQQNYQPNVSEANQQQWPYQNQAIKKNFENHQHKLVIPCLSRQKSNNLNPRRSNEQWIPTFKATVIKPSADDFLSRSLREEDRIGKHNNFLSDTKNGDQTFSQKLNTLGASSIYSSTVSENDCDRKTTDQNVFHRSMPDSSGTIEKQEVNLLSSQKEETSTQVHVTETSEECNENKDTISNSRRSNSNKGNLLPVLNETMNKTEDKNIFKNDDIYLSGRFDSNENGNFNNKRNNDEQEQANRYGATEMTKSSVILMQNSRTCYACSSANDPSCWHPSRRTTVKYCRKGNDACVTRTFRSTYGLVLTRDCGQTCEDISFPGLTPNYKSCSICHHDLCNGAYSFKSYYLLLILFFITLIKYSL